MKTLRTVLILLLALGLLCGCAGGKPAGTTDGTEPAENAETPAAESDYPVKSVKIDGEDISAFHILYSEDDGPSVKTAAGELQKYIELATGAKLEVTADESVPGKRIAIAVTEEDSETYSYKSDENGVTISGGRTRGALYGAYGFLGDCLGVRFLTADTDYVIPSDGIELNALDHTHAQYFEYRNDHWFEYLKPEFAPKLMLNAVHDYHPIPEELGGGLVYTGNFVHTIHDLAELPEDFSGQPCFCDEEVYQTVLKNVRALLEANPDAKIISVSQGDGTDNFCRCDECKKLLREEKSHMGALLRFVNRIAEDVGKDYPDVAIQTLAYNDSFRPPKITKPLDNVIIQICTNTGCNFHPVDSDCELSETLRSGMIGWGEICQRIYVWDYTTDFQYYIMPFPNLNVLRDDMRFFYENGVRGMFSEGNYQAPHCELGELRGYLTARLMQNPYMTEEEYEEEINVFLKGYYGAGWENIRKYIDFMMTTLKDHGGSQKDPHELLDCDAYVEKSGEITAWFDAAEDAADNEIILEHIQRSRFSYDYIRLGMAYESAFAGDDEALQASVTEEVKDFIRRLNEQNIQFSEFQYRICYPGIDEPVTGPFEW